MSSSYTADLTIVRMTSVEVHGRVDPILSDTRRRQMLEEDHDILDTAARRDRPDLQSIRSAGNDSQELFSNRLE
jgi:hypothetical protein